jgi:hypothetical protein
MVPSLLVINKRMLLTRGVIPGRENSVLDSCYCHSRSECFMPASQGFALMQKNLGLLGLAFCKMKDSQTASAEASALSQANRLRMQH